MVKLKRLSMGDQIHETAINRYITKTLVGFVVYPTKID